jgi:GMP synthase (glutamine-hydrolysing)
VSTVVILDFGAQYSQLIARRVREARVYSELLPFDAPWEEIAKRQPAAIILSGGPESTLAVDALECDPRVYTAGIPLLGICYGMQLIAKHLGGSLVGSRSSTPMRRSSSASRASRACGCRTVTR